MQTAQPYKRSLCLGSGKKFVNQGVISAIYGCMWLGHKLYLGDAELAAWSW